MTFATFTTALDHTSDGGFRVWGAEFNAKLAAIGMIQTSDTGQANWTTATRPSVNVVTPYEIWKFIDSSIYIKILYGTGSTSSSARVDFITGQGSNGSGTLTGQVNAQQTFCNNQGASSASTPFTSYFSHTSNFLTLVWKVNANSTGFNYATLVIGKTVDGSGAATTLGYAVVRQQQAGLGNSCDLQTIRLASTAFVGPAGQSGSGVVSPIGGVSTGLMQNGNLQVYCPFIALPEVLPFIWTPLIFVGDGSVGSTFTVAMVASVNHTYLMVAKMSGTGPFGYGTTVTIGVPFE